MGGWLVTEPWITTTLYDTGNPNIVDEYTFCQHLGREEAKRRLMSHWDSFYQEADLQAIKSYGLNHVRIPIGYWAFDISAGEPYVQGQFEYLKKAVDWAGKVGLKVMIVIHGAPGSQNGFDNSGKRGDIGWAEEESNVARTRAVLAKLAEEFSQVQYAGVVTSLEALNEPAGFKNDNMEMISTIKQYYYDGYKLVRHSKGGQEQNFLYAVHDAFLPLSSWAGHFPHPAYQGVALDTHIYTIFTVPGQQLSDESRIQAYCKMIPGLKLSQESILTFVGEFTPAPNDCAPHLNGIGRGSRYDGTFESSPPVGSCQGKTGSGASFSEDYKKTLAQLFEVQTTVYERTSGWFMWTFKTEKADEWSYDAGVKGGWIPKDLGMRKTSNQCQ